MTTRQLRRVVVAAFLLSCLMAACSNQQAAEKAPETQGQGAVTSEACRAGASATTSISGNAASTRRFNGNDIALLDQSDLQRNTLCDILLRSGRKVAIFQFAGVFCTSCQEEATYLTSALQRSQYNNQILNVVVFVDFKEDRRPADVQNFMQRYAPQATIRNDDQRQVWTFLSPNNSWGTNIIMNVNGEAEITNTPGQQQRVFQAAERLAASAR